MRNLRTYFKVIFDSSKISDANLRKFAEINLQRLAANNPDGVFTTLISATTTAYQDYFGNMVDEATRVAIQKGLTLTMNEALDSFIKAVRRQEGRIRADFDKPSATYMEFYPQGLEEYNQASLADVETLMKRYAEAGERHAAQLGQSFVATFTGLHAGFIAARQAQLLMMGEVQAEKSDVRGSRDALEDQLMDNLLTLAMKFKRDPDGGMAYFDQSFLRRPARTMKRKMTRRTMMPQHRRRRKWGESHRPVCSRKPRHVLRGFSIFGDMIPKPEVDRLDARGTVLLVMLRDALFDFLE